MNGDAGERLRHQEAWELIPWYVNGTLVEDEAVQVEAHLARCPLCRREVDANRELAAALRAADAAPAAPDPRLERLLARLDEPLEADAATDPLADSVLEAPPAPEASPPRRRREPAGRPPGRPRRHGAAGRPGGRRRRVRPAACCSPSSPPCCSSPSPPAGWSPRRRPRCAGDDRGEPPARFHTLSQPSPDLPSGAAAAAPGAVTVRLLFAAGTREEAIRRLLLAEGGRFVAGPSPSGVYTAAFDAPPGAGAELVERLRRSPVVELVEAVRAGRGAGP